MSLNVLRGRIVKTIRFVNVFDEGRLGLARGHGDALRPAVGINSRGPDDGTDRVPILEGLIESLEDESAGAFTAAVATGIRVEGSGVALRVEERQVRQLNVAIGGEHQAHAAGNGHLRLAGQQTLTGQMGCHETR